jgi:predicted DNA-binding transcriptional regulator
VKTSEIKSCLKELELSEHEISAYLVCLRFGTTAITPVARMLKLPRTTLLYSLESLEKRGLISFVQEKDVSRRYYRAASPQKVLALLRQHQIKIESQIDNFNRALPDFNNLYQVDAGEPKVRLYDLQRFWEIIHLVTESDVEEVFYAGNLNDFSDLIGEGRLSRLLRRMTEKEIWANFLLARSRRAGEPVSFSEKYFRRARYTSDRLLATSHTLIFNRSIAIFPRDKKNSIITLTSPDFSTTIRSWFSELWQVAEEVRFRKLKIDDES